MSDIAISFNGNPYYDQKIVAKLKADSNNLGDLHRSMAQDSIESAFDEIMIIDSGLFCKRVKIILQKILPVPHLRAEMLDGENIAIPANVVTPSLRKELEKRNVQVVDNLAQKMPTAAERASQVSAHDMASNEDAMLGQSARTNIAKAVKERKRSCQHRCYARDK